MEPPLERLITDAIAHGLWSYSWIFAIVSAVVAAAGAMVGAYLKKAGELRAIQDGFRVSLKQLRTQTQETESIKTSLASLGGYLRKAGELQAIQDSFTTSLSGNRVYQDESGIAGRVSPESGRAASHPGQLYDIPGTLRTQTEETESINTGLASQLDALKDLRERERSFSSFQRSDIATHRDAIIELAKTLVPHPGGFQALVREGLSCWTLGCFLLSN
jgi:hypothetical protein